jgi:hypothetical protein
MAPADSPSSPEPLARAPAGEPPPEEADRVPRRIEEIVQRTQRSVLEGFEGILARQVAALVEHTRRSAQATEEVLSKHADLLMARLKAALRETAEELRQRQLESVLQRLKETALAALEEARQKHVSPLLAQVQEVLGEALRRQVDQVADRVRQELRDGSASFKDYTDQLVVKMRETVAEPMARALRVQVPEYARRAGGRVLDYALAATLFCVAAVLLPVGAVQGLQQTGLPAYLTYILGGLGALGIGLVFLRLYARPQQNTASAAGGSAATAGSEKSPPL